MTLREVSRLTVSLGLCLARSMSREVKCGFIECGVFLLGVILGETRGAAAQHIAMVLPRAALHSATVRELAAATQRFGRCRGCT